MILPDPLVTILSQALGGSIGMDLIKDTPEQPLPDGGTLWAPPAGARVWMGHHAVLLCVPVPLDDEWRTLARYGARWLGEVLDAWWKRGRNLDGYLAVVFETDPNDAELSGQVTEWEGRTHICRRQAIWPIGGGWDQVSHQLTIGPLPPKGERVSAAGDPDIPVEISNILKATATVKDRVDAVIKAAKEEEEHGHAAR